MGEILMRIFMLWTVGLGGWIFFKLWMLYGRLKVDGYSIKKLLPPDNGLTIAVHKHPSLWEVFALPLILCYPHCLYDKRFVPFSLPDRKNYGQIWFSFIKPFVLPLNRENSGKFKAGIRTLLKELKNINFLIIAPEGGRTFKGEKFKYIENDGQIKTGSWEEAKDKPANIRVFEKGILTIVKHAVNVKIVPIGIELKKDITPNPFKFPKYPYFLLYAFWRKARVIIGEPITEKIKTEDLEDILLRLSQKGKSTP